MACVCTPAQRSPAAPSLPALGLGLGLVVRTRYDALGRTTLQVQGTGADALVTRTTYEGSSPRVLTTQEYVGVVESADPTTRAGLVNASLAPNPLGLQLTTRHSYDSAGQRTSTSSQSHQAGVLGGVSLRYRYDGAGQLVQIHDQHLGQITRTRFDASGRRPRRAACSRHHHH